ncbi:MAG: DUF2817 domain-containing protein [Ilumatobacteraceae bacterium]
MTRRAAFSVGLGLVGGLALRSARASTFAVGAERPGIDQSAAALRPATRLDPPPPSRRWSTVSIGPSALGRPIEMWTSAAPAGERRRILVVSGVHGNEVITRPLAESIAHAAVPDDVSLSIIASANPDGWAKQSRRNAHGVDLNRNFPWRWSRSDGGHGPASAPETRALMDAVVASRADLAVWIHQPLAYVAPLHGCPREYADAWRAHVGDRRRDGLDQHGGGETWTARVAGIPSMLVEVATWSASSALIEAHTRGFQACVDVVRPR